VLSLILTPSFEVALTRGLDFGRYSQEDPLQLPLLKSNPPCRSIRPAKRGSRIRLNRAEFHEQLCPHRSPILPLARGAGIGERAPRNPAILNPIMFAAYKSDTLEGSSASAIGPFDCLNVRYYRTS
jgi:hypothetical protein